VQEAVGRGVLLKIVRHPPRKGSSLGVANQVTHRVLAQKVVVGWPDRFGRSQASRATYRNLGGYWWNWRGGSPWNRNWLWGETASRQSNIYVEPVLRMVDLIPHYGDVYYSDSIRVLEISDDLSAIGKSA
jgi:hypothetical protein